MVANFALYDLLQFDSFVHLLLFAERRYCRLLNDNPSAPHIATNFTGNATKNSIYSKTKVQSGFVHYKI